MSNRVLLVEDDIWRAELELERLRRAGFEVVHAAHAQSAITKIDDAKPDAIVADVLLSGATVMALLHELQSYPDTKDIPVVVYTDVSDGLSLDNLKPYGVQRIVDKTTMGADALVVALRGVLA